MENADGFDLKKEMPPEVEDNDSEKGRARLWVAVCRRGSGQLDVIEKSRIDELREALNDPDIVSVETIYRAFRKEFTIETKIIRKLGIL